MRNVIKGKAKVIASTMMVMALLISAIQVVYAPWNDATARAVAEGMRWDFPGAENYNASSTRLTLWYRWRDQIPTWVFIQPSPNPVGVGQPVTFIVFNPQVPPAALLTNDIRYEFDIIITKPDGKTETLHVTSDSTGAGWTRWTPDQVGNHTITAKFKELFYRWYETSTMRDYYGTTFKESTYTTTLVVQQEPVVPKEWKPVPLPTEYWSRPIEGQNTNWWQVASNWLGNAHDRDYGGSQNRFQTDGTAPNTGHILWTKQTEDGGVVGGDDFSVPGEVFNAGHQYQTRFTQQIIMWGRLYYQGPLYWSGTGEIYTCVDLRTGETLWTLNLTAAGIGAPSFGYYYDWDDPNQHGVVNPGWLFTANFARAIHPRYGYVAPLNITNVPSGFEVVAPKGEVLRYAITNYGTTANPAWYLTQWNSSKVFTSQNSGTINASLPTSYDFNVSLSVSFTTSPTIRAVMFQDVLLGSNGTHPTGTGAPSYAYPENVTFWALSLKPGEEGRLLWMKTITTVTPDNQNIIFSRAAEGVFVFVKTPTCSFIGYDMYTGEKLWETEPQSNYNPYGYFTWPSLIYVEGTTIAYGKLFTAGYVGMVFCYDLKTGKLLWRYEAPTGMEKLQYYTLMLGAVCDGKIYVGTHEHSADTPLFKGNKVRCLDVETGKEVWTMLGWAHPQTMAIADGILIYWNNYDHQIYAIGKGASKTTVEAPATAVPLGSSVIIRGTVMDISPGTKQHEQAMRFPNGVPAVADECMSQWMEYVYMQKERPADVKGVWVTFDAIGPDGKWIHIGGTHTDASGFFSVIWTPPAEGHYTIVATFPGSESYWPSYAETSVGVTAAPPAIQIPEAPQPIDYSPMFTGVYVAVAIAILIGLYSIYDHRKLRKQPT